MDKKRFLADMQLYEKMQQHERLAYAQGYMMIAGVDEAGRGPLAGPVIAAACILNPSDPVYGLNDSKKLTPAKRSRLFRQIREHARDWQIGLVDCKEIDQINILQATHKAMHLAINNLKRKPDLLLIDAVELDQTVAPVWSIIKGDGASNSIAAASILAKVTRDQMMEEFDQQYPGYGFSRHKGYGTPQHIKAVLELGPCPIHRRSFLRKLAGPLIAAGHVTEAYFQDVLNHE